MLVASLAVGIVTGLASAMVLLLTGHNISNAILGYSLCGIMATLVVVVLANAATRPPEPADH